MGKIMYVFILKNYHIKVISRFLVSRLTVTVVVVVYKTKVSNLNSVIQKHNFVLQYIELITLKEKIKSVLRYVFFIGLDTLDLSIQLFEL